MEEYKIVFFRARWRLVLAVNYSQKRRSNKTDWFQSHLHALVRRQPLRHYSFVLLKALLPLSRFHLSSSICGPTTEWG